MGELDLRAADVSGRGGNKVPTKKRVTHHTIDLWPPSIPGEPGTTAVIYQGTSRRIVAAEADVDLAICVLECAARIGGRSSTKLLEEGWQSSDPKVRATARRLEQVLESPRALEPSPDPEPPGG